MVAKELRNEDGLLADRVQISGWEPYALDRLTVLEGDISRLYGPGGRCVAARYFMDDYGNARKGSHWAGLGDTVTLRYGESLPYGAVTSVRI